MNWLTTAAVIAVAASSMGCVPDWAAENETGLIMEIASIGAVAGGTQAGGGEGVSVLFSDVASAGNTTINDDAVVTVNVYRKNPTVTATSALEHVRLESYQVRYFRSDGHSVEGVDVPHRITGPINAVRFHTPTAEDEVEIDVPIVIVRQQAKREPPLVNLVGSTSAGQTIGRIQGEGIIYTTAEITVFARQVTTGEGLQASGRLQVAFADWVDQQ